MEEFYKALRTYFNADITHAFYTGVSGRFSYGEAADRSPYPYAVYHGMPASNEDTFTETIDGHSFQVNIYSEIRAEAMVLAGAGRNLFNGATITLSDGREVILKRELVTPPWKNGDEWVASLEFSTFLQE